MPISRRVVIIGGASAVGVTACGILFVPELLKKATNINVPGFPPIMYPDFQTWPTPRDFDGPGSMFHLDGEYLEFRKSLKTPAELAGNESTASIRQTGKWNGGVLANFTGIVDIISKSERDYDVTFDVDGAQRWRVDLDEAKKEISELDKDVLSTPLFLVTESISVTKLSFLMKSRDLLKGNIKSQAGGAGGSFSLNNSGGDNNELNVTFAKPHYIFYRAKNIKKLQGLDKAVIVLPDRKEPIRWSSEGRI